MRKLFRTRARLPIGLALALAVLAGCGGSRVSHDAIVAAGNGYDPGATRRTAANAGPASAPEEATGPEAAAGPATQGSADGGATPSARPRATSAAVPVGRPDKPRATPRTAAAEPTTGLVGSAPAGTSDGRCTSALSPIRLGQTLASSGLIGASIGGLRTGVALWAKDVNARGGVQCHPIQLTQLDDASDPARVSANWNTLVHVQGAVALIGVGTPVTIGALRTAAERDRVPVLGSDLNATDYFQSPYLFPQGGLALTAYDGSYVMAAREKGPGGTAGLIYCVEVSICTGVKNNHEKAARRAELKLGPIRAASLTQPDYAAECQAMKQAGVTVLFLALDGSGSSRAARSCVSIGYTPAIASSAIAISAAAGVDKNLRQLGTFLGNNNVPFMSDSPAAAEFRAALARIAPSAPLEQQALLGWASGKLFEAALAKVADRARAGDVTTQMVLEGLWQLKNEKLGGLAPGLTFVKGKGADAADCFYGIKLGPTGYTDPLGAKPKCFEGNGKAAQSARALEGARGRGSQSPRGPATGSRCASRRPTRSRHSRGAA
ncbi:MAG: ABC transporter substrate-binding protein [Sporichthyaceae bacterium]